MNINDFYCMNRGKIISFLTKENTSMIMPVYQDNGQKNTALLLLHGFSSTPAVFRYLSEKITDYDAIIIPALPGHVNTLADFSTMKKDSLINYVNQLGKNLVAEYNYVDVLGLSMGGVLAYLLSCNQSLRHLYLLAPAFDLHLNIKANLKLALTLRKLGFQALRSQAGNLHSSKHYEIAYKQLPINSIIELFNLITDINFTSPSCFTDLFLGKHDKVVNCEAVAKRFSTSSNTRTHWLENSAHVLPLDNDMESIAQCITANNSNYLNNELSLGL